MYTCILLRLSYSTHLGPGQLPSSTLARLPAKPPTNTEDDDYGHERHDGHDGDDGDDGQDSDDGYAGDGERDNEYQNQPKGPRDPIQDC